MTDIQRQVEAVIAYSQEYPFDIDCTTLIEKWKQAKQPFIDKFKGELIVRSEHPVKVILSADQQARKLYDYIDSLDDKGLLTSELQDFLLINQEGFLQNRVVLPYPSKHIMPGAKLLRSLQHFIDYDIDCRWAQDIGSRFIQETKVEGYLYLSVHPLDFLTLSENNANWYSCQALDGDYRTGNLSYMTDSSTLVAYITDKQEQLKCMPEGMLWNSKKWRMLIHTDMKNNAYYNRQYPYDAPNLIQQVYNMLAGTLGITLDAPYYYGYRQVGTTGSGYVLSYNNISLGNRGYEISDVVDLSDYVGFADLRNSSTYTPLVSVNPVALNDYNLLYEDNKYPTLGEDYAMTYEVLSNKVGGKVPCVHCGKEYVEREDKFLCETCIAELDADDDFFLKCSECGHHLYPTEDYYYADDTPMCKHCYHIWVEEQDDMEDDFYG